jgi:hypothetical protein
MTASTRRSAEVPEPSHPEELKVGRCQTFLRIIFFKTGKDIQISYIF